MKIVVFIFLIAVSMVRSDYYDVSTATALETSLLTNYKTNARPNMTTPVNAIMSISQIVDIDIVKQTVGLLGFLVLKWDDYRLKWNPTSFGTMTTLVLKASQIWKPPVMLANAADSLVIQGDETDMSSLPIEISNGGMVSWFHPIMYTATCEMDITYYPFDKQSCSFVISVWLYDTNRLTMSALLSTMVQQNYEENGEWSLDSTSASNSNISIHTQTWSAVTFSISVTRKYAYYIINMIIPVMILNFLGILVHTLPIDGDKVAYSLTILLSLSVLMTVVADKIPSTSLHISLLSVYLVVGFGVASLEAVMSIIVLKIFNYGDKGRPVSPTMQRFVKCMTCKCRQKRKVADTSVVTEKPAVVSVVDSNWNQSTESIFGHDDEYSYKEIAATIDFVCFVMFAILTVLYTLVFLTVLATGPK